MNQPASIPVKPRSEPREERPSKDAVAFERWLKSEPSPGNTNAATPEQAVQAGTVSITQAAQDLDQTMAVASVFFEWTATATYLMSYVDHHGRGQVAAAPNSISAGSSAVAQSLPGTHFAAPDLQAAIGPAFGLAELHAGGTGVPVAFAVHDNAETAKPLRGSSATGLGALAEWMSRSIKQITDADGRSTLWVRDYQISAAQLPALLDALLHTGHARPDRIMLNGAPLWQSASPTQRINNGD
nr:hypothetical protein [Xanthomonas cannabis]